MKNLWAAKFVARVVWNALAGGFLFAVVGALCLGAGGWLTGTIIDFSKITGEGPVYARMGARLGIHSGAVCGVFGVFIFGVAAFRAPGEFFAPLRALGGRVALGQVLGTLGAASSFFLFEFLVAQLPGQNFALNVFRDAFVLSLAAPVVMLCGAIAGALSKRPARRSATLKAQ